MFYRSARPSELNYQIKLVHEGVKKYKCDICGKPFGRLNAMKVHVMTVHEGLKNFQCGSCDKAFGQHGDLKRHIKNIHEGGDKK